MSEAFAPPRGVQRNALMAGSPYAEVGPIGLTSFGSPAAMPAAYGFSVSDEFLRRLPLLLQAYGAMPAAQPAPAPPWPAGLPWFPQPKHGTT